MHVLLQVASTQERLRAVLAVMEGEALEDVSARCGIPPDELPELVQSVQYALDGGGHKSFFHKVIDQLPLAVLAKSADLRFILWNRYCETLFGMRASDTVGRTDADFFPPEQTAFFREKDLETLNCGQMVDIPEEPVDTPSLGRRWVHTRKLPLYKENGDPEALLVICEDITARRDAENERRVYEEELRKSRDELSSANVELARAARLKDEFLASMSHELRTPLAAILTLSEALQDGLYGKLSEPQKEALATMDESGRHLLDLINDVLDVSRIEAGQLQLQIEPCLVEDICQASLRMVREQAQRKGQEIAFSMRPAGMTMVADARRVKQILVNLLSNAVKFTPPGRALGLEVTGVRDDRLVHFHVWDEGIGISEEDQGRLFRPFVQLDSRLSRMYNGTGLGLCLVHRLAEAHGGGVRLESRLGEGSHFTISLPWQEYDAIAGPNGQGASSGEPSAGRGTVLVVDDYDVNLRVLGDLLRRLGYEVNVARTGAEALDVARRERPDLVLMDIQMPGMDGLEAIRRMRADDDLKPIPVVALTALAMPGDRDRCLLAGATRYLARPVKLDDLAGVLRDLIPN